jgi:hypothetical protein
MIKKSCLVELVSALVLAVALKNVGSFYFANISDSFSVMTGVSPTCVDLSIDFVILD